MAEHYGLREVATGTIVEEMDCLLDEAVLLMSFREDDAMEAFDRGEYPLDPRKTSTFIIEEKVDGTWTPVPAEELEAYIG